jgi:3-dehydroquinate synthase
MTFLTVNLQPAYKIFFVSSKSKQLVEFLRAQKKRLVIITDDHLKNSIAASLQNYLAAQNLSVDLLSFPAGERHKTRETKALLEDQLLQKNYSRDTCLIAVGGGIVTDLSGFIAATYCRGISAVYVPTTLLAMVDASIGGKTAVDTPYGKNMIGCFYQPSAVFIDCEYLNSLSDAEFNNGLVEAIKHGLIADSNLFNEIVTNASLIKSRSADYLRSLIFTSCAIKKNFVEQDEHDLNRRNLLNFGHTIGHAIETLENYQIRHGEAVAIGIIVESYLSLRLGFLKQNDLNKIIALFKDYQLPLRTQAFNESAAFKSVLINDKKSQAQTARFVLLDAIGTAHGENNQYTFTIAESLLDEALQWAKINFSGVAAYTQTT